MFNLFVDVTIVTFASYLTYACFVGFLAKRRFVECIISPSMCEGKIVYGNLYDLETGKDLIRIVSIGDDGVKEVSTLNSEFIKSYKLGNSIYYKFKMGLFA